MKSIRYLSFALVAGALACSDATGPEGDGPNPITLNVCSLFGDVWLAYQNEGADWKELSPNSSGQIAINATDKVSIAIATEFFGSSVTQILNVTADELQAGQPVSCDGDEALGLRNMNGTVSGLSGTQEGIFDAGTGFFDVSASNTTWSLDGLPNVPVDIIGTRYASFSSQPADRIFVRRNVTPPNGAIPTLDFASSESAAPLQFLATLSGYGANAFVSLRSEVVTANGTDHALGSLSTQSTGTTTGITYNSLPDPKRLTTDQHILTATSSEADGQRNIAYFYGAPADRSLTFGPLVSAPVITDVAATPIVRPRAQIASQTEYPSAVTIEYDQSVSQFQSRVIIITTTAGFAGGTPQTWDVTVPDMSAANYATTNGLSSTTYDWGVIAYGGSFTALSGGAVPDGTTILSSVRGSVEQFSAAKRALKARFPKR